MDSLTVYSAPWCGHCQRLKSQLTRAGIPFTEVDVDHTPGAIERITEIGGGSWLIPTVVMPDGTGLVNPSLREIRERLGSAEGGAPAAP
ncbi:glutaredoxin domain-containing protein [Streptosporangium sp. NPDC020072]|uniref:glutaredoxin family protein n=1 Tax=unclassified Streptosporangium TaxID=2632669 RepID=UPI00342750B1